MTNIMTYVCKALVFHIMQRNRDMESQREKNKTDRDPLSLANTDQPFAPFPSSIAVKHLFCCCGFGFGMEHRSGDAAYPAL